MTELDYLKLTKERPHMDPNQPDNSAVKPGAKTTEAIITLVVAVLGAVMASGLLDPADATQATILKVIGLVLSVATVLGYQASRTSVKNTAAEVAGAIALEKVRAAVPQPPAST